MPLNRSFNSLRESRIAAIVLFSIILLRLISFGALAIADPTESRYAEVAKRMYETRDWITPRLYMQGELVPYWGKPPLHFWLTSASFKMFGVSEWASRLPSILAGLITLVCVFELAKRLWGSKVAWLASIILSSSGLFFVLWGASVVDVTLTAALTIAMIAFPLALANQKKSLWGMVFFLGLALATLTKGLVAPAIAIVSTGIWWLLNGRPSLKHIPWFWGTILYLAITIPWFALEESRTPGFLKYFIVNEHLLRFMVHDYGDKYGSGHMYPRGTIWIMLVGMYLPWTIFIAIAGIKRWKAHPEHHPAHLQWFTYFFIWGMAPAIFFTMSRQILGTYLLPGFAGLAIVTAVAISSWTNLMTHPKTRQLIYSVALIIPVIVTVGTFILHTYVDEMVSVKPLFSELAANQTSGSKVIVFPFYEPPSADFYESGFKALSVYRSNDPIKEIAHGPSDELVILKMKQLNNLPIAIQRQLRLVGTRGEWAIYGLRSP